MTTTPPRTRVPLEDDPVAMLGVFQEALPVRLISTSRNDFTICRPDETVAAAVARARAGSFGFLPVVDTRAGRKAAIVGVVDVAAKEAGELYEQTVGDAMRPLGEEYLIGADASILAFIRDADHHPFRLVVSGNEISGLVTVSDLQRLPVRGALFAMVTQLEMTMAEVIRRGFAEPAEWITELSPERAGKMRQTIEAARTEDTLVDPLLFTQFGDKVSLINRCWPFPKGGASSKTRFQKEMKDIQQLRDNLAHANDYASTRDQARRLCECVRKVISWIELMIRSYSK